ncbi:XdhC family protein [Aquabacterium sp. OR-4]|uniref:XdhC family protein n=1 Tax=Aquabacterium sp. OR-4 TaxID=2978127 RepID=UPI0021B34263|nr:XdhC family protein [Aquabacterium sp. OR-4]MDT7837859.1 XdhC family protein [Aquabacterium sp. OR-4]
MDNVDLNVLRQITQWLAAGHRVVLGTITRTWGSAPRPPGSTVAVRDDGLIAGSVSGGCIEDDLIDKARGGVLAAGVPQVIRYGIDADAAHRFGLPCGGLIELVLEPVLPRTRLDELLQRLADGQRVRRVLSLASGEVSLQPPTDTDELELSDATLTTHHGPHWRLLLIGAGQMTQYLAQMGTALGYQVIVCDPREEYAEGFAIDGATLLRTMPDDTVRELRVDGHTAVIALTHDPKLDDLALMEALTSEAFYVGAIGSRANQAKRRERLMEHFGISAAQLDRLHGPVGLKNGARTPPEIAVSILAEVTAVRYGFRVPEPVAVKAQAGVEAGCVS